MAIQFSSVQFVSLKEEQYGTVYIDWFDSRQSDLLYIGIVTLVVSPLLSKVVVSLAVPEPVGVGAVLGDAVGEVEGYGVGGSVGISVGISVGECDGAMVVVTGTGVVSLLLFFFFFLGILVGLFFLGILVGLFFLGILVGSSFLGILVGAEVSFLGFLRMIREASSTLSVFPSRIAALAEIVKKAATRTAALKYIVLK